MKREVKIILIVLVLIGALGLTYYMFSKDLMTYAIVFGAISLVTLIFLIVFIRNTRSEESIYKSTLRKILKNYDSILVQSYNFPKLSGKNIIRVTNLEDLMDAQLELRKPIYYMIEGEDSCSFVLLDNTEACIYILKKNDEVESPLELIIAEYEKHADIDESLLADIERTTIIKLSNMKSFRVSPIKKKTKVIDESQIETL